MEVAVCSWWSINVTLQSDGHSPEAVQFRVEGPVTGVSPYCPPTYKGICMVSFNSSGRLLITSGLLCMEEVVYSFKKVSLSGSSR